MRCRIHAISAGTEIDPVKVDLEYLILRKAVLEPQGQQRLSDLAGQTALRRQKQDLGELLGNRAAALDDMPGAQVDDRSANQPDRVDPEMAIKAAILGRDHRLRQKRRHLFEAQGFAEQIAETGQRAAVLRQDRDGRPTQRGAKLAGVGEGQREIADCAAAQDRGPQ